MKPFNCLKCKERSYNWPLWIAVNGEICEDCFDKEGAEQGA